MKTTLLTCTGDRPEAFALCEKMMARQTSKWDQWIVLDDGKVKTPCTMGQEYHYVPEFQGRGSLVKKLRHALGVLKIEGDVLCFIEDDDWYARDWLETCNIALQTCDMFGEGKALYYNVRGRWWFEHTNMAHASLCATAIRKQVFPLLLEEAMRSEVPFIDVAIWAKRQLIRRVMDPGRNRRTIGIKAMPGRTGYGGGHRGRDVSAADDPNGDKLRSLLGPDADNYSPYHEKAVSTPMIPMKVQSITGQVHGPNWAKWLAHLQGQKNIRGAEIGTFKGESAEWMLDNIFTDPSSTYTCIDPFTGSVEHHVGGVDCSVLEREARARLQRFPNALFIKGYSNEALGTLDEPLDFIYIDGAHDSMNVLRDAVLAFERMKPGGTIVFDDYEWAVFPNIIDRPKMAVDAFVSCYAAQLEVVQRNGSQVCVRKK